MVSPLPEVVSVMVVRRIGLEIPEGFEECLCKSGTATLLFGIEGPGGIGRLRESFGKTPTPPKYPTTTTPVPSSQAAFAWLFAPWLCALLGPDSHAQP